MVRYITDTVLVKHDIVLESTFVVPSLILPHLRMFIYVLKEINWEYFSREGQRNVI